ncbi:hypothetical protein RMATCC62417_12680 [Rhizopus microsporus]|nr:hypothetical protein RMATCC62417_12680 [Rhizopus microsporus]
MLNWITAILLTPFLVTIISFLTILAVITSTITSSFIFIRLAFLTVEMISGLTIESTNWLLSACLEYVHSYLTQHQKVRCPATASSRPTLRKQKLPPSSLYLNSLSHKPIVKSAYSVSVPGTPDPESFHHQMAI